jgi:anti-repressor protein
LDIGQNRLFEKLREDGYLMKSGSSYNLPTQRSMDLGLMMIKETTFERPNGLLSIAKTAVVTGKGQRYFVGRYVAETAKQLTIGKEAL